MKSLILIFALLSVTRAVIFDCSFIMRDDSQLSLTYSCNHPTLLEMYESETVTAVYGTHMSGKSNADVRLLRINGIPTLPYFPRGIENFFPNLNAIGISNGNIASLQGNELDPFRNLTWFVLDGHSPLQRIPGNLFANTPLLTSIWLYGNKIKQVGENLFNNLPQLRYANFFYNYCINRAEYIGKLPELIENIRTQCPSCPNMSELVCTLNDQNQVLMQQNTGIKNHVEDVANKNLETNAKLNEMSSSLENMAIKNTEMDAKIDNLSQTNNELVEKNDEMTSRLDKISKKNKEMDEKLDELSQENLKIKEMLHEVLDGILELTTRP